MTQPLTFWFEFASTYSYLSAMRIEEKATAAGVDVTWRPFLLGPIFQAQGWTTSPFNVYPAKGQYMWRDMQRLCADRGLDLIDPPKEGFPQNGLMAARIALAALEQPEGPAFCREIYQAQFAKGQTISDPDVIAAALAAVGLPETLMTSAQDPVRKAQLRTNTDAARSAGLFGAPSFTVADELFWGDDRLDMALACAQR
jgi:2-hydroxychromene-2-carboxylate isomerase